MSRKRGLNLRGGEVREGAGRGLSWIHQMARYEGKQLVSQRTQAKVSCMEVQLALGEQLPSKR